ncbi:MAG: hydrogenase maturation protease [Acidobacteriota bacterium]|jgi:hydrogenase maturation protease|nr:hydrogenase maturation protease [Acidobacteriota bacterium]
MANERILIAGLGNIFLGDDAFGSEVARKLMQRDLPENVRVVDFGIRGLDLAYTLLDAKEDVTILVDATPRGGEIGTLYTIEPDLSELNNLDAGQMQIEPHGMNPMKVLAMVKSMGGEFKKILLVGCEPEILDPDEEKMGLNEPVALAVDEAVKTVESLINKILGENSKSAVI